MAGGAAGRERPHDRRYFLAHLHNDRHMWLLMVAKGTKIPAKVNRHTITPQQARAALKKSAAPMHKLFERALGRPDGRLRGFSPGAVAFLGYMVSHDAHHRGQICMLARQMGHRLPLLTGYKMWHWWRMWKQLGFKK